MRKTTACFLIMLCSAIAFGQQQPQWTVVQSVVLFSQSQAIPQTTLLTPTEPGLYRLTVYFSGGGGASPQGAFDLVVVGTDISGVPSRTELGGPCAFSRFISLSPIVSLKPSVPLTFEVDNLGTSPGCVYNLAITVEQLVQQ